MHIPGRSGEVEIEPGRIVSRQRAEQLRHPERYAERQKKWKQSEVGKASRKKTNEKHRKDNK